ncbi:hypothetical protein SAMN05444410_1097 [Hydrobacter penzbergensis]|uniref:Lipoprotein n=1 Tax=Hydrobacter penzbergensis TaxID=1235997 RepID=A0A8X8IG44_9BACT|nr:hypothetical protein [Hydrobacter penzbergensis]SDX09060.1 hypothetical protein SAMN05444410_1097 [Hydrobacter penzbergensis]
MKTKSLYFFVTLFFISCDNWYYSKVTNQSDRGIYVDVTYYSGIIDSFYHHNANNYYDFLWSYNTKDVPLIHFDTAKLTSTFLVPINHSLVIEKTMGGLFEGYREYKLIKEISIKSDKRRDTYAHKSFDTLFKPVKTGVYS